MRMALIPSCPSVPIVPRRWSRPCPDGMPELIRSSIERDIGTESRYGAVMYLERINPAELGRPSGFSHAVSVTAGRLVFLAGQIGAGRGGKVVAGGIVAQFRPPPRNPPPPPAAPP